MIGPRPWLSINHRALVVGIRKARSKCRGNVSFTSVDQEDGVYGNQQVDDEPLESGSRIQST